MYTKDAIETAQGITATTGTFSDDVSGVDGTFSGAVSGTTGTFSDDVSGVDGTFSGAVSGTTGTFSDDVSGVDGTFSGAVSGTTGTFSDDVSGVDGTFSGAVSGTTGTFSDDVSGVDGTFSGAVSGTTGTFSDDVSGVDGTFSGAVSGTTGTFSDDVSGVDGTFSGAVSGTTGTFSDDVSGVDGTFSGDVSGVDGTFSGDVEVQGTFSPADFTPSGASDLSAGNVTLPGGCVMSVLEEAVTILGAASTDTTIEIPAGSRVLFCSTYVKTVIPTSNDWDIGPKGGTVNLFGDALAVAATTETKSSGDETMYDSAVVLTLTMNGSQPATATGVVHVRLVTITAPGGEIV